MRPELAVGELVRRDALGLAENTRLPSRTRPSWVTMVPIPALVKISSSSACGTRPSVTVARVRPPSTARRHASILGTMPDSRWASARAAPTPTAP